MQHPESIYEYIKTEEASFDTDEIRVGENWMWNFKKHVQLIFHLKNGIFFTGENNWLRAFKNIMDPILNLAYWSEDIELKDVVFYIEQKGGRVLSFLIKKYHDEVYVKETNLDEMFDEITESDLDYGGALVQKTQNGKPQTLDLNTIAFCDQTDIDGGPIGFKLHFGPDKLRKMEALGWGKAENGATTSISDLIMMAEPEKDGAGMLGDKKNRVTGKTIEVYIVRGNLPEHYLEDNNNMEDYYCQVQIVAYYRDKKDNKIGVTLYRKRDDEKSMKFHTSKKVYGRALGRGEGEALLHPQIWTNFATIHKMNLLEAGGKVGLYTDDASYSSRNQIRDMENLEITTVEEGKTIQQIPTLGINNIKLFEGSINEWYEHAQLLGSAFDPMLGKEAPSGSTFRGQERVVAQGKGIHDRRRGQRAKFIEEIYRDWILPDMARRICKGKEFLATLTSEEMQWVSEQLAENYANHEQAEYLFRGEIPPEKDLLKQKFLEGFAKKGSKQLIKILKDEFRDIDIKMGINVAGKQKDLAVLADKLLSIFQAVIANPVGFQQTMQMPGMSQAFNDILEYSGMNQSDFYSFIGMKPAMDPNMQQQPQMPQQMPQMQLNQPQPQA
jgi:hypothetical protein